MTTPQPVPALAEYWPLFGLRLATPRLQLTPMTDDDLVELVELALAGVHDPADMPFAVAWTDAPRDELILNSLRFWWAGRAAIRPGAWAIGFVVRWKGTVVGTQSVETTDFAVTRTVHTGSWLGRSHQGQGIGTEMRSAVLDFAFDHLKAVRAESGAFVDNPASLRVSEKLGYQPNGTDVLARRGTAATNQRLVLTPQTFRRPTWQVQVAGLEPCRTLLGLDAPA